MKLLIVGHGRHGKDTAAEIVRDLTGLQFRSSSYFVAEHAVYPVLREKYGYTSLDECYEDRVNHREEWRELITAFNTPDKTRLCRGLLEVADVYVGLRCKQEYDACRELFDFVLWVDRSKWCDDDVSMTFGFDPADMVLIDNNGSREELRGQILSFLRAAEIIFA